ncbi:MAG: glycosyltransferase family 4 protein [Chloroflexi bacterium]|nr:glycosyltransferase family 4 protein [Chloroflexota bacterium]
MGLQIAVDASRTTRIKRTGTENYALQLIHKWVALDQQHHLTLYFRDMPPPSLFPEAPNIEQKILEFPRLWTHVRLAGELWRTRPDVTFVPAHTLPFFCPGKAVVTIHDLGYLYFPEAHPSKERHYLDITTRYSSRRATLILADSLATKNDLIGHYQVPEEKIRVVYPGVDESLKPMLDPAELAKVRAKYGLPERYLFFLGTLQPRKNIARLVEAFAKWRSASGNQETALVLGGQKGWLYQETWTAGVEGVILPGYIADEDVAALYSGALALVFPSLYEGFGFPVIEAMRCDTPVLCSNTSSLPELGGEAALLVNPLEIEAIAHGIGQLVENAELRGQLVEKGRAQAQKFSWGNAANQAMLVLEEAAGK